VALPDGVRRVEIVKLGRSRLVAPAGQSWDEFFDGDGPAVSDDFMRERERPPSQEREGF
jgi:antitoxin VapB